MQNGTEAEHNLPGSGPKMDNRKQALAATLKLELEVTELTAKIGRLENDKVNALQANYSDFPEYPQ